MSMMYCDECDKQIDMDFDAEHFEEHLTPDQQDRLENLEDQAELFSMDVDYETLELVPKRVIAKKWQFTGGDRDPRIDMELA